MTPAEELRGRPGIGATTPAGGVVPPPGAASDAGGGIAGDDGRSLRQVVSDVIDDVRALVKGEIALARAETEAKIERLVVALISIIAGALLGFSALNILLAALVAALDESGLGLPTWLSAVIVGGLVALVGFLLVRQGQKGLALSSMMPERTAANVRADAQLVRNKVS